MRATGSQSFTAHCRDTAAEAARAKAANLDHDPKAAAQAISVAEIERTQLQGAAKQLRDMLAAVLHHEAVARYAACRDKLQTEGDAIEQELLESYTACASELLAVVKRAVAFKEKARTALPPIPPSTDALRAFDADVNLLLDKTQLYDADSGKQLWPPAAPSFAVVAAAQLYPSHAAGLGPIGPGWGLPEVRERFEADRQHQKQWQDQQLANMSKEKEERENRDLHEQFAAGQKR